MAANLRPVQWIRDLQEGVMILRMAAAAVQHVEPARNWFLLVAELATEGVRVREACLRLDVAQSRFDH